jgi:hypothetical protein
MTIGEQTKKWYDENEPGGFAPALLRCFLFGLVVKRPEFVLLAEPVRVKDGKVVGYGPGPNNCWWVWHLAAPPGTTTPYDWMAEAPYTLPYLAFKRRGKMKLYSWDHIRKDVYGRRTISSSTTTS